MKKNGVLYFMRLNGLEMWDFRNVESGKVQFPNSNEEDYFDGKTSVLGLYGQNGSGKTSVIMALGILKSILSGNSLSDRFNSCVREGCNSCKLKYSFSMFPRIYDANGSSVFDDQRVTHKIEYSLEIEKREKYDEESQTSETKLVIKNEVLQIAVKNAKGIVMKKQTLFDASGDSKSSALRPKLKHDLLCMFDKEKKRTLIEQKAIAMENSKSFLFCDAIAKMAGEAAVEFADSLEDNGFAEKLVEYVESNQFGELKEWVNEGEEKVIYMRFLAYFETQRAVISSLRMYGRGYLHVLDTSTMGHTSINNELPLMIWNNARGKGVTSLRIALKMDGPTSVSESLFEIVGRVLANIGNVLGRLVPGMTLGLRDYGKTLNERNVEVHRFEITSNRNGTEIPLKYESDGIRRIVSIMSLLIAAYNDESFTIAIDEIDSGIFEYLLGELISIMAESARGQLIFTSHNLRPLEMLSPGCLCFTTTNPQKRFTTLPKRGNSNLRDCYFRSIVLGAGKENVYNPTDRYEIEMALRTAGEVDYE